MIFTQEAQYYKDKSNFFSIVDAELWEWFYRMRYKTDSLDVINGPMPLRVVQSKGVEVKPDVDVNITDLSTDVNNRKYKQFVNTGNGGITFKIDVIIHKNDTWGIAKSYTKEKVHQYVREYWGIKYPNREYVTYWLRWFYNTVRPLYIVTDAIDVPNGMYVMTDNPTRRQDFREYVVWTLEFATYFPLTSYKYDVLSSLNKYASNTVTSSVNTGWRNCTMDNFVYYPKFDQNKPKITTKCTRWLQQTLYENGYLKQNGETNPFNPKYKAYTGWYGPDTYNAVKKFQEKYKKFYPTMRVTGKMDKITQEAMEYNF